MATGFSNGTMFSENVCFNGTKTAQITTNGQLLIGSAVYPYLRPATLKSIGGTVTITNGAGTINLEAGSAVPTTFHTDAGDAVPLVSILNVYGQATPSTSGIRVTGAGNTASITMYSPFKGDFTFTQSTAGTSETFSITQTDNTNAASNARAQITSGGAAGGDPYINLLVSGAGTYSFGIDNSDSDKIKITTGASPSAGTELFTLDSTTASFPIQYLDHTASLSGAYVSALFGNSSNTADSFATLTIATGGASAGDPTVLFASDITNTAANCWRMGLDNSDSDKYKLAYSNVLETNTYVSITTASDITFGTGTPTVAGGSDKILVSDCWNLVGGTLASEIFNTDNTNAGSRANLNIRVGGSSAGDAVASFIVNGANTWSMGLDNSDSDNFKLSSGVSLGVNDIVTINAAQAATLYLKSMLQSYSNVADVTGFEIDNPDTTNANSSTRINQRTEIGGGDTEICFDTSGAGTFMMGSRRTDSCFVLTSGFNPATKLISGTDRFKVTTGGAITFNNAYTFPTADGTSGQVLTTNGAGVVSWEGSGGGTWAVTTVDATAVVNKSYIANKAGLLTMTLPATAAIGDTIRITGINTAVGWRIAQNANQRIHVGLNSSTAGVGGYIEATAIRDSVELVCVVAGASSEYNCVSMMGNITVA